MFASSSSILCSSNGLGLELIDLSLFLGVLWGEG